MIASPFLVRPLQLLKQKMFPDTRKPKKKRPAVDIFGSDMDGDLLEGFSTVLAYHNTFIPPEPCNYKGLSEKLMKAENTPPKVPRRIIGKVTTRDPRLQGGRRPTASVQLAWTKPLGYQHILGVLARLSRERGRYWQGFYPYRSDRKYYTQWYCVSSVEENPTPQTQELTRF